MGTEVRDQLLAAIASHERLESLRPEQARALTMYVRELLGDEPAAAAPLAGESRDGTDLLTIAEAAAILKVSRRWLYRHAKKLPFTHKFSRKVLRFSRASLERWVERQRS